MIYVVTDFVISHNKHCRVQRAPVFPGPAGAPSAPHVCSDVGGGAAEEHAALRAAGGVRVHRDRGRTGADEQA